MVTFRTNRHVENAGRSPAADSICRAFASLLVAQRGTTTLKCRLFEKLNRAIHRGPLEFQALDEPVNLEHRTRGVLGLRPRRSAGTVTFRPGAVFQPRQQFRHRHVQHAGDLQKICEADILLAALDLPDAGPVQTAHVSKLLLRPFLGGAQFVDALTEQYQ